MLKDEKGRLKHGYRSFLAMPRNKHRTTLVDINVTYPPLINKDQLKSICNGPKIVLRI